MAEPFLRWAGGKRWLAPTLIPLLREFKYDTYIEPFLGGGSMFFSFCPKQAALSDLNSDLVNAYRTVKRAPHQLKSRLAEMPVNKRNFYKIRAEMPEDSTGKALRFIYLNRTCFRGLYRVNKNGEFNVPYRGGDRTPEVLTESSILEEASIALRKASISCSDFSTPIRSAKSGDLIFCDPTYTSLQSDGSFLRYNDKVFSWEDQIRLCEECREASRRGVSIVVSNIYKDEVKSLYHSSEAIKVSRPSHIGVSTSGRKDISEYVFFFGQRLISHVSGNIRP